MTRRNLTYDEVNALGFERRIADYRGEKFGKLEVVDNLPKPEGTRKRWVLVKCACGTPPFAIRLDNLLRGRSASCGCQALEKYRKSRAELTNPPKDYTKL